MKLAPLNTMRTTSWCGLLAGVIIPVLSSSAQVPAATVPDAAARAEAVAPASLSPGAAEVIRLATAGVGDEVVLSYIRNSQAQFNLSADDVLYLKDLGLPAGITSAMLDHDGTLRAQEQQYAPAAVSPAPVAPAPAAVAPAPAPAAPVAAPAPAAAPAVAVAPAPVYVSSPPPDVAYFYDSLAPYGTWVQLDGYGWCWQPTAVVVTPGWRPYCHGGSWVYSDFGWYWHSTYSWGWAPFHYGRWHMHPRTGWVWLPDRVWGPAWVTWRSSGDYCGWAPLPPHAVFDIHLGWRYNGVSVSASFGFGLGSDAFLFVGFGDFFHHDLHRRCLPRGRVGPVFHQTTIVNNYIVRNNRIEHPGIPVERFSSANRGHVPRATVRDWKDRPDRMPTRAGSVVYRPQLEAPARSGNMVAQRLDAQNPVIRHTPSATPARGQSFADAGRSRLESDRVASRTSSAAPPSASRLQSAPASVAAAPAAPAARGKTTSDWTSSARAKSAPQVQPTQRAAQPAPAGQAARTAPSSGATRLASPKEAQAAPEAARTGPAAPVARSVTTQVQPTQRAAQPAPAAQAVRTAPSSGAARGAASTQTWTAPSAARTAPAAPVARSATTPAVSSTTRSVSTPQVQSTPTVSRSVPKIPAGPATPRAPAEWKQGTRSAPGYRSDAGLPALYNKPKAVQSPSPASRSANQRVYQPKTQGQSVEARSQPVSRSRSTAEPASRSPRTSSSSRSGR